MSTAKLVDIRKKLAQGEKDFPREDVEWLLKRVDELTKENEWLKKELTYSEYQGEVGF